MQFTTIYSNFKPHMLIVIAIATVTAINYVIARRDRGDEENI